MTHYLKIKSGKDRLIEELGNYIIWKWNCCCF